MKLGLVTFHRDLEGFTKSFSDLAKALHHKTQKLEVIVFVDRLTPNKKEIEGIPFRQVEMPKTTKYKRILHLLDISDMDYFLFIDNDIESHIEKTVNFVENMMKSGAAIGWGKIMAMRETSITGKVVAVDKLLSHNFIRPLLWRLHLGISVPGQCFIIKANAFKNKIAQFDTFLDDISFGILVQMTKMKVYIEKNTLGYEKPNSQLKQLFVQRKRWANGFTSILYNMRDNKVAKLYLSIHALFYHFSWILFWGIFISIFVQSGVLAGTYFVLALCILCGRHINLWIPAALYTVIFPILHLYWFKNCFSNYMKLKREKNV